MTKKTSFIICLFIVTAFFIFKIIQLNIQRLHTVPQINTKATYDTPQFDLNATESAFLKNVTSSIRDENNATDSAALIQNFKSGEIMTIFIPKQPVASASALKRDGKPTGLQISTEDYYSNIFHLISLDNSHELCKSLSQVNAHQGVFVKSRTNFKTKANSTTIWELTNTKGTTVVQTNSCYVDGGNKAWIVDFYIDSKKYPQYKNKVMSILDTFKIYK